MTIQEKMVKYRAAENITLAELARRSKLSYPTVLEVERGKQPTRLTLAKLEAVVGGDEK